ncbi:MAG: ABC transporter permease [Syntrophobacteraceae bacterium]
MFSFILRRLALIVPILFVVALIAFGMTFVMPGGPARVILGDFATRSQVAQMNRQFGLDKPVYVQFVVWLRKVVHGDLGSSLFLHAPVSRLIVSRMPPTLLLAFFGQLIGILLGIPAGVISALRRNGWPDRLTTVFSLGSISVPSFWLSLMMILFFGVRLRWFPVCGYRPFSEAGWSALRYLVLPAFTLGIMQSGIIARMTRSSMIEVLEQDYIRTARAKGLPELVVIVRHALKNALLPVTTVIGIGFGTLLCGTWIVETIFYIPGTGALTISAILNRDFPVIQGSLIFTAIIFVVVNLFVDICYLALNPRLRKDYEK